MTSSALAFAALSLYIGTFSARQDAYVWDSRWHKDEPLTPDIAEQAFLTGHSVSGYMASMDSDHVSTTVAALDLDEGTMADGGRVRDILRTQGIPSLLVESRRGCHLWTFHEGDGTHQSTKYQPVPAAIVRRALVNAAKLADLEGPKVEVFPKTSGSHWGVGALRMPLMPHPKDGVKRPAYDMDGVTVEKVVDIVNLTAGYTAPYKAVYALSGHETAPVAYPADLGPYRRSYEPTGPVPLVSDLLLERGVSTDPGRSVRCPFHQDKHASLSISKDDLRAWCKAPTCQLHNEGRGLGSLGLQALMKGAT